MLTVPEKGFCRDPSRLDVAVQVDQEQFLNSHRGGLFYRWCKASASGLEPEGEADTSNAQATVSHGTVATWVKDLNPKQLRAVAEECDTSQNPRLRRGATGVVGRGGVADPHGRTGRSGVTSSRPVPGRSRGIKFACGGGADQNGEASGLVPEVLHHVTTVPIVTELSTGLSALPAGGQRICPSAQGRLRSARLYGASVGSVSRSDENG
jgi:hypothetical protein